jgi:hypothetical protein
LAAGILIIDGCLCSLWLLLGAPIPSPAQVSEPLKVSANSHYFKDAQGTALILNGSQTWNTFPDWDTDGSAQAVDFAAFVKFLTAHGHNFTLLWTVEMSKFCGLPTTPNSPPDFTVSPLPYQRTGPGTATDGGLKFDLTKCVRRCQPFHFIVGYVEVRVFHSEGFEDASAKELVERLAGYDFHQAAKDIHSQTVFKSVA